MVRIRGLEEYPAVSEAYDRLDRLLKEVAETKAYIEDHEAGTEFLKAEEGEEFNSRMKEADEALEQRLVHGSKAVEVYDMLTKTALYDKARKQWNRSMNTEQEVKETTRNSINLLPGIVALAAIGRTQEARAGYEALLHCPLYDKERKQWNISMTAEQKLEDTDRYDFNQLIGIVALASIGRKDEAKEVYDMLTESPLYDKARKQWNTTMNVEQKLEDTDRYGFNQLIGIVALASIGRKDEAKKKYEMLKETVLYDASCRQWNLYMTEKQEVKNSERHSLANLIGVSALASIGEIEEAKDVYEMLTESRLYDKERKQWNWIMNAAQIVQNTNRPAFAQLWGVIALAMLEGRKIWE